MKVYAGYEAGGRCRGVWSPGRCPVSPGRAPGRSSDRAVSARRGIGRVNASAWSFEEIAADIDGVSPAAASGGVGASEMHRAGGRNDVHYVHAAQSALPV